MLPYSKLNSEKYIYPSSEHQKGETLQLVVGDYIGNHNGKIADSHMKGLNTVKLRTSLNNTTIDVKENKVYIVSWS